MMDDVGGHISLAQYISAARTVAINARAIARMQACSEQLSQTL